MQYEDYLSAPEWQAKRAQILARDWNMCQVCMSSKNLQVHHKAYVEGRLPWDYDDVYLITLCGSCHSNFHRKNDVPILKRGDPVIEGFSRISQSLKAIKALSKNG